MAVWGAAIHAAGCCAISGRTDHLEAHHIIPRSHKSTRYAIENGILLNRDYHRGIWSAHNKPLWFMAWLKINRPEQYAWVQENKWKIKTCIITQ